MKRIGILVSVLALLCAPLQAAASEGGPTTAEISSDVRRGEDRQFRIGIITYASLGLEREVVEELKRFGYVEGKTVVYRSVAGNRDLAATQRLARELVEWKPDLIVSLMTNAHVAVQEATKEARIPVVFWSADPMETGVVKSFTRPGTNFTGFSNEAWLQDLELRALKWVMPEITCVGHLWNHTYAPAPSTLRNLERAGRLFNIRIVAREALSDEEIQPAIEEFAREGCGGFIVGPHELLNRNGHRIGSLALANKLAAVSIQDSIVEGGGLIAYSPPFKHGWKAMADVIDRILRGADPASIPVERGFASTMTLNLRAARELNLALPPELIDEANRIIQ